MSSASIKYRNADDEIVTHSNATLPWSASFYVANGFTADLVAVLSTTEITKSITARLYVDGELVREDTSISVAVVGKWIWQD